MATGSTASGPTYSEFFGPECIPDYDKLVTEDEKPVDNLYSERQHLLLTQSLIDSWPGPGEGRPRYIATNVGLFYAVNEPPFAPDVMVSVDVTAPPGDPSLKENRSYFIWKMGKAPEAVVEVVSNVMGGELTTKLKGYARFGVLYYIVWDPFQFLGEKKLHCFVLERGKYVHCEPWFPVLELGVTTWDGVYGDMNAVFLRWCDQQGRVVPTGAERAEKLAAKLRAMGIDPDQP